MSRLNWINPEDYSFDSMLLMERFQINYMLSLDHPAYRKDMGIALKHNPTVAWYFRRRCPEQAAAVLELSQRAPDADPQTIYEAEKRLISGFEDFIIYTTPERMDKCCDFIYGWDKQRLFEMADFCGKLVLDVGSGSGRLAFAAAEHAELVIASEPVDKLREYMRDKIRLLNIRNMKVADGMCDDLPYPDNTFDIVMSGHVVGDDIEKELAELTRVLKPGGWLLDCPGDQHCVTGHNRALLERGWEEMAYIGPFRYTTYRYRKQK